MSVNAKVVTEGIKRAVAARMFSYTIAPKCARFSVNMRKRCTIALNYTQRIMPLGLKRMRILNTQTSAVVLEFKICNVLDRCLIKNRGRFL